MGLSTTKRTEIENKLFNVLVKINFTETVLGSTVKQSKSIKLSELTDKEICKIFSDFNWGMKKGLEFSDDRTEGTTITWEL